MGNLDQTRRIDRVMAEMEDDSSHCATLVVLKEQQVRHSATIDTLITTIGRGQICSIALDDDQASRQHAQIRLSLSADGTRQYWLSDLGSTNGTFFNGKRLESNQEVVLTDGDKFVIGRHQFKFAVLDQSTGKFMTGNLRQISLFDLIQLIENNRLTAVLVVRTPTIVSRLYFNSGLIVDCEFDSKQGAGKVIDSGVESEYGMAAFRKLAAIEDGLFEVEEHETQFPQKIETTTNTNLMLDTLRELDEEREAERQKEG